MTARPSRRRVVGVGQPPDFGTDAARGNARDVLLGTRERNSCGQAAHYRRLPGVKGIPEPALYV